MAISPDQRAILKAAVAALLVILVILGLGYFVLPAEFLGPENATTSADRLTYALQWDLPLFLWLIGCVQAVSSGRYRSPPDIRGSAYGTPSPKIALRRAILQNSLEQTVIGLGAHLILATVLRGHELRLIPLLVLLFIAGRIAFAIGYAHGPGPRGFGMVITALSNVFGYGIAMYLLASGR